MQKLAIIRNIGDQGINLDLPNIKVEHGVITGGNNFRVANRAIESLIGPNVVLSISIPNVGLLHSAKTPEGAFILILGRANVAVYDGAAAFVITPVGGLPGLSGGDEALWTACNLGVIPIVNNPQSYPHYWSPQSTSTLLLPLPFDAANTWQDMGFSAKSVRSHGSFLFAMNLQEGAVSLPDTYRWSHPADTNGIPFSWDPSDLSTIAGRESIGGDGGQIIDGRSLRDNFVIYSENAINILQPSGDEFIWRRTQISSQYGLASKESLIEVDGRHFFIVKGDILVNDGASIQSIAHNHIKNHLDINANYEYYKNAFSVKNTLHNEIWFCVPENGSVLPNKVYVFNYRDGTWSIRSFEQSIAHAVFAQKSSPPINFNTYDAEEFSDITFETFDLPFSYAPFAEDTVIGVGQASGFLYSLDDEQSDIPVDSYVEVQNMDIDNIPSVTAISRIYPYMTGNLDVDIQVGSQDYLHGPVRWKQPVKFNPSFQKKVDIRTTGEFHALRVSSKNTNKWFLSGLDIEYITNGER